MSKEFDDTIVKLKTLIKSLESSLLTGNYKEADILLGSLRNYDKCFYCVKYRATLEEKGWSGCCGSCPCHKLGEEILGRRISYNGCYKVGPYKDMVKTAFQFKESPCREMLEAAILEIYRVVTFMQNHKEKL